MMVRIGLVCLVVSWTLVVGAVAQCGGGEGLWYTDEPPSVEATSMLSFEEASDEYYQVRRQPRHQQQQHRSSRVRSSRYTPGYGYGNDYQELERTWEKPSGAARKPTYGDRRKSRRQQQGSYVSRSQRTDYQVAPVTEAAVYERRKANRAAKYSGPDDGPEPGHKTATVAYKVLPPKPGCAQNLLIGCTPTVTRVPCSASMHEGYGATPYYPPAPPMTYSYHEPAYGYEPHPAGYHHPPAVYQKPAPSEFHQHPGAGPEGPPPGYAPSYKSSTGPEELPGFAAPVREDLSESPKVPIISAFSKPQPDQQQSTMATANEATSSAPQQQLSRAAASNGTQPSQDPASHSATPMPALPGTTEPKEDSNAEFWNDTESSTDAVEATTSTS